VKYPFEKKIAIVSAVTAILSVVIAAIGLVPSFLSMKISLQSDDITFRANTSARKMQSTIQGIADTYFDDVEVSVNDLRDGSKQIDTTIYAYNDESIDERNVISYAEKIFTISEKSQVQINSLVFNGITRDGEIPFEGLDESLIISTFLIHVTRTTDMDDNEIWVSFLVGAKTYDDLKILGNEYNESEVFRYIDFEQYDIEKTHYEESVFSLY